MRWTRSWTVALVLFGLSIVMYIWSAIEAEKAQRAVASCMRSYTGWLPGLACMQFGGMEQAFVGFFLLCAAAIAAAWGARRLYKLDKPRRERARVEAELAQVEAELADLNRTDS